MHGLASRATVTAERAPARVLLGIQLASLAIVGAPSFARGFPLDDSWIYAVFARNLVTHHTFGFEPGRATSGATSPAWSLVSAVDPALLHLGPPVFMGLLNAVLFVLLGQGFLRLLRADGLPAKRALAVAAAATMTGNFVWFVYSGMEPVAVALVAVAFVLAWFSPGLPGATRGSLGAALLLGLLTVLRPETLPCVLVVPLAMRSARRRPRDVALLLGVAAVVYGTSLLVNQAVSGTPLPTTLSGRRWLFELPDAPIAPIGRMGGYVGLRILHTGLRVLPLAKAPLLAALPAIVAFFGLAGLGAHDVLRRGSKLPRLRALVLVSVLHSTTYLVLFPVLGNAGRYQPLAVFLTLPLAMLGALRALDRSGRRRTAGRVTAPAVLAGAVASLFVWRTALRDGIDFVDATHRTMARRIREELPPDAVVASFDIGALGYESGHRIVDLGGLVDRDYLPFLWGAHVDRYLIDRHVSYVVLPEYYRSPQSTNVAAFGFVTRHWEARPEYNARRLGLVPPRLVELVEVEEVRFGFERWITMATLTAAHLPRQVLYRVAPRERR